MKKRLLYTVVLLCVFVPAVAMADIDPQFISPVFTLDPVPGLPNLEGTQETLDLSLDTTHPHACPSPCSAEYDTQLTSPDFSFGDPVNGETTVTPDSGNPEGLFHIHSFFDVFTDISLDGGQFGPNEELHIDITFDTTQQLPSYWDQETSAINATSTELHNRTLGNINPRPNVGRGSEEVMKSRTHDWSVEAGFG